MDDLVRLDAPHSSGVGSEDGCGDSPLEGGSVSGHGVLLPIPDDPRFGDLVELWPAWDAMFVRRSVWLKAFEDVLREFYPQASSRDLSLTARHAAPFYLADGPNVP